MTNLIFAGHFDIGEKVNQVQKETIERAKVLDGDLAILIGDIGFALGLATYAKGGLDAVVEGYKIRLVQADCNASKCIAAQLPSVHEIPSIIDEAQYKKAIGILSERYESVLDSLRSGSVGEVKAEYNKIIREEIVPELIKDRLTEYGLEREDVNLYFEKSLRTKVSTRTRGSGKKPRNGMSWRRLTQFERKDKAAYIGDQKVLNERGMPICRGIMLALFEKVARMGYDSVTYVGDSKYALSTTRAQKLYGAIAESGELDQFKSLEFKNEFYEMHQSRPDQVVPVPNAFLP